jgi:hypothetical protein
VVVLHRAVLLVEWLRSPPALPAGGDGGPPLKINRVRDKLLKELTDAEEAKIGTLLKKAVS